MSEQDVVRRLAMIENRLNDLEAALEIPRITTLLTPLTAAGFSGNTFSTTAKTLIDLSAVFGVPAGIKSVYLTITITDSASAGGDYYVILSPNNTAGSGLAHGAPQSGNSDPGRYSMTVPCNSDGDIYYQISASGVNTFTLLIQIWGYTR